MRQKKQRMVWVSAPIACPQCRHTIATAAGSFPNLELTQVGQPRHRLMICQQRVAQTFSDAYEQMRLWRVETQKLICHTVYYAEYHEGAGWLRGALWRKGFRVKTYALPHKEKKGE